MDGGTRISRLPVPPGKSPLPWQEEAREAIFNAFTPSDKGGGGLHDIIVTAATGTGKGTLMAGLAGMLARKGRRVIMLFHRSHLLLDMQGRLKDACPELKVGTCGQGKLALKGVSVVCALFQTLSRGDTLGKLAQHFGACDVLITDECHLSLSDAYLKIVAGLRKNNPEMRHLGLSATPWRTMPERTKGALTEMYPGGIVFEYSLNDAIADGVLCPIDFRRTEGAITDVEGKLKLDKSGEDYSEKSLSELDNDSQNAQILAVWQQQAQNRLTIGFGINIDHCKRLAQLFRDAGIKAEAVWAEMDDREKHRILQAVIKGDRSQIDIVFSRDLLTTGFDAPPVSCVMLSRPTASLSLAAQMVGRGTRRCKGKENLLVLDMYDSVVYIENGQQKLRYEAFTNEGIDETEEAGWYDEAEEGPPKLKRGQWVWLRKNHDQRGIVLGLEQRGHLWMVQVAWKQQERETPGEWICVERIAPVKFPPLTPEGKSETQQILSLAEKTQTGAYSVVYLSDEDPHGWFQIPGYLFLRATKSYPKTIQYFLITERDGWQGWALRKEEAEPEWHVHSFGVWANHELGQAIRSARQLAARSGTLPDNLKAAWRQADATDAQRWKMASLNLADARKPMTKGEAALRIDAEIACQLLANWEKRA